MATFLTSILGEGWKKPNMYMVMPYMEHDLSGLLENPDVQFTEPQIKCYMMQLLEGLRYLHAVRTLRSFMKKTLSDHHRTVFCIVT